jgi:hypothetical protein|tara:strand:- start:1504 stop:1764 length:261 start_codon:yes stop_codon:yes gene_type:complete
MKSTRHVAQLYANREQYGQDPLDQTCMTNFDGELEEIENYDINESIQTEMVAMFWAYVREDTESHNLEKKTGKVNKMAYEKEKYRL